MEYEELSTKLAEFRSLKNRLNRYWSKLVKESLVIAKNKGLEVVVSDSETLTSSDIVIKRNGEKVDVSELIELARKNLPSLYRRYYRDLERYSQLHTQLNQAVANHKN